MACHDDDNGDLFLYRCIAIGGGFFRGGGGQELHLPTNLYFYLVKLGYINNYNHWLHYTAMDQKSMLFYV